MGQGGESVVETSDVNSGLKSVQEKQEKPNASGPIDPQPVREEQVQNAVNFLAHPKVKGSPIVYRRSFLEQKGLTKEEIDEAFRRVPDSPSEAANNGTFAQVEQQLIASTPSLVPASQQHSHAVVTSDQNGQPKGVHWTKMVLAIGVFASAGAGAAVLAKNYILPKFKSWLCHVVLEYDDSDALLTKPDPPKEASSLTAAATAAAAAASDIAVVTRDILTRQSEERRCLEHITKAMEVQTRELKLILSTMRESALSIERETMSTGLSNSLHESDISSGAADFLDESLGSKRQKIEEQELQNTTLASVSNDLDSGTVGTGRPLSVPPGDVLSNAPHSASYMQIIAMLERGEKPPNIKDIDDKPPNPFQAPSSPKLQPRVKPWEVPRDSHPFDLSSPSAKVVHTVPVNLETNPDLENGSERSAVVVETVSIPSSSDAWQYKKMEEVHAEPGMNGLPQRFTEAPKLNDVDESISEEPFYKDLVLERGVS